MTRNHARALPLPHLHMETFGPIGAGLNWDVTVPDRVHWEIQSCHIQFTTDANAANRVFRLETGPVGNIAFGDVINSSLTANTTYLLFFGRGMGYFNNLFQAGQMTNPWPAGMLIPGTHHIRTVIDAIQVGDVIDFVRLHVSQWQDPVIL